MPRHSIPPRHSVRDTASHTTNSETTASGGREVVLRFVGVGRFEGVDRELRAVSEVAEPENLRRERVLQTVIVGLLGYLAQDGLPAGLTLEVASVTAANKVYDGSATASVTAGALTGLVGNETLAVAATGQFDTPGVGSGKPVNVSLTLGDGSNGGLASNYVLASVPHNKTVAGVPARVVGETGCDQPSRQMDQLLRPGEADRVISFDI